MRESGFRGHANILDRAEVTVGRIVVGLGVGLATGEVGHEVFDASRGLTRSLVVGAFATYIVGRSR